MKNHRKITFIVLAILLASLVIGVLAVQAGSGRATVAGVIKGVNSYQTYSRITVRFIDGQGACNESRAVLYVSGYPGNYSNGFTHSYYTSQLPAPGTYCVQVFNASNGDWQTCRSGSSIASPIKFNITNGEYKRWNCYL